MSHSPLRAAHALWRYASHDPSRLALMALLSGVLLVGMLVSPGCQKQAPWGPPAQEGNSEPVVRVRIRRSDTSVTLASEAGLFVSGITDSRNVKLHRIDGPVTATRFGSDFYLETESGSRREIKAHAVVVTPRDNHTVYVNGDPYPQRIVLYASGQAAFDVINHVGVESYLPGVLIRELYGSWRAEAFEAQAVAARSYTLVALARSRDRHYDVESTVADQAYGGRTTHSKALDAVAATRGLVLTYQDKIVPAYYASSCGGTGQDAAVAFPNGPDIPPLRGHRLGDDCAASSRYRWGPLIHPKDALAARLVAWGRATGNRLARLQGIASMAIIARNDVGRPARFAITDTTGEVFELGPENFRFACGYAGADAPPLDPDLKLLSSHVTPEVHGDEVHFIDGRGWGHGVGMCQWGAQGLALRSYRPQDILASYYPHAGIERLY